MSQSKKLNQIHRSKSNSNNTIHPNNNDISLNNPNQSINNIQQNNSSLFENNQFSSMQNDTKNTNTIIANNNKEFLRLSQKVECSGKIPTARFGHIMVLVSPTKAVLFGGAVGDTKNFSITNDTFCYNVMTKIWNKLQSKFNSISLLIKLF